MTHPSRQAEQDKEREQKALNAALTGDPNADSMWPLLAGGMAVGVSVILVIIKSWAYFESGSASVLAAVIDSMIDILISATNFGAIWYASKPADLDHRHGHGKAEGVAALFQSAFIFGSSLFVFLQAVRFFTSGQTIDEHNNTIIIMVTAIILNFALVLFQTFVKRKSGSLAVEADQAHYTGDILIHVGVIASVWADQALGLDYIDPLVAILVCAWLIFNARSIAVKALDMLLDRELDDKERERIIDIIKGQEDILGAHDLRTRRSGRQIKMALDIEVEATLSLKKAHDIAIALEYKILKEFPGSEIMIHIDPFGEPEDVRHQELDDDIKIT